MKESGREQRLWQERRLRVTALVLALATVAAVICAAINFVQRARYVRPYDGIKWEEAPDGVRASIVWQDTPGDLAGIRPDDLLLSIDGAPIHGPIDVTKQLFRAQPGRPLTYELKRLGHDEPVTATVVAVRLPDPFSLRGFLEPVGLLYLIIGLFVLLKRWNASHAVHFYLICLTSFIFYAFSYSGKFNVFDWSIYWSDVTARLLLPALFLHFALAFPEPRPWLARRRWLLALVYLPAAVMLGVHIVAVGAPLVPRSLDVFDQFDQVEYVYFAILFLLAAGVFEYTYRRSENPVLTQQLKWVTRGTWLAIVPFTAFYVVPALVLDNAPNDWMKASTLALVFLPLLFGYAIIRYRLMDVDVIFRRGVAYTLATAAVVAIYFGIATAVAALFLSGGAWERDWWVFAIALIVAALFFQPIKDWTQDQLDRLFYGERFDYRRTLEVFGRELSSEINLDRLLERLLDRLSRTLNVERIAIFLTADDASGAFHLVRGRSLGRQQEGAALKLGDTLERARRGYLVADSRLAGESLPPGAQNLLEAWGLQYVIPCRAQSRSIALLVLGKTAEGGFLSSEDLEMLQSLADYIAIALENARLYKNLEQKAAQVAQLQEFSENILESTSVGLVAVDPEGGIESWNSAMERLAGRPRAQALRRPLAEVFPSELMAELDARRGESRPSGLYKFYLARPDGQRVVTNISLAPLVSKQGQPIGRLLLFEDITQRVQLESQLLQAEKLSSIGLLAAGVAHEVNTPLAVISNYAQMLAKQLPPTDARGPLVEKIVKQTFRASAIISNLLNFSRTGPSAFADVDLNRALSETLALLEPQLRSGNITVEAALDDGLAPVFGDQNKLQQVFLNLLFNARDAMPQGGRLAVRTRRHNARVQVEISDTGVGIPPENLGKIYDPFFSTKATGQGTGLGLAVSYGIVQEHKGAIRVRSRVGQGTTFVLEFPVPVSAPQAGAPAREVQHHG